MKSLRSNHKFSKDNDSDPSLWLNAITPVFPPSSYSPQSIPTIISKRLVLPLTQNGMVMAKCISHNLKLQRLMSHAQSHTAQSTSKYSSQINGHAAVLQSSVTAYCSSLALQEECLGERVMNADGTRK